MAGEVMGGGQFCLIGPFFLNVILRLNRRMFVYNFSSSDAAELLRVGLVF